MWNIYKHTFPNGKVYIGLTKQEPEKRFKNGYGYENCPLVFNAIQKYGWNNVITSWLYNNIETIQEAGELERKAIQEHHSNEREYGYNLSNGGQGGATNKYNHDQIYQYWLEGNNIVEIVALVGCSSTTVRRVLDEYNVPSSERMSRQNKKGGKPNNKYNHEIILQDWLSGLSTVQLCEKYGCGRGTVQIVLNNANIPLEEREIRRKQASAKSLSKKV